MEGAVMAAAHGNNELISPEQLADRMGISLRMVREMYYTNLASSAAEQAHCSFYGISLRTKVSFEATI
jgi:hypothetical protein